ncbi:carboxy-S-adenosyl-L-methionine synthase CmoA [Paraferrimonas sedimenticola]|uniref:Carboxy-S-adenosyl-L-methionine synthase n=1 Tax=Paraferrimonas sedimenticola TaxID=375674 RepID=A0AA37RWB2_9GAMM|nr:carboxy-S-adenosyl-L-methionine synthase CmoA [Paraferrimonas sedimenticola]GLP96164.1 carboxy-S-adenosyl-L-methionine synthase [Paraferrimonas sedimenticola]
MSDGSDRIYAKPHSQLAGFRFDQQVVDVFPDMINRSVPGYGAIIHGIGQIARTQVTQGSLVYDLGCSLGAATHAIRRGASAQPDKIIAVDLSESMIERASAHLDAFVNPIPVQFVCADIRDVEITNASLVVLNFTLQFLAPDDRQALINLIYEGLNPGGCLIVSEKIHFEDQSVQSLIESLHLDFKRANGYSELEISQKRSALENVLIPDTLAQHYQRFTKAGFEHATTWHQELNFCSMVAIK